MSALANIKLISNDFYHIRSKLTFLFGMVDVGTQMGLIKLSNGKFLVIDTVNLTPGLIRDINHLTDGGKLIDSVIATHPYHTLYFQSFYDTYPNAKYYGTKRHVRTITKIKWEGAITEDGNLNKWESEGIFMRVPEGCDFDNPINDNHFAGIFLFHAPSKTVFIDDTISYFENAGWILSLTKLRTRQLFFTPTIKTALATKEAPLVFKTWCQKLSADWDFDNITTAHKDNLIGDAKVGFDALVNSSYLDNLSKENELKK